VSDTAILVQDVDVSFDLSALARKLRVSQESDVADLRALVAEASAIARPKGLCRLVFVDGIGDDMVILDGIRFDSRVLRVNLGEAARAFAHVATCGVELDAWAHALDDVLHRFWAEAIKEAALRAAARTLSEELVRRYDPGEMSGMAPGSLMDWPLTQQRPLFQLLGDPEAAIGVRLTPSCLMEPNKSVSGLRFPTSARFESCQLCPRAVCANRRAPYDPGLYDRRYRLPGDR